MQEYHLLRVENSHSSRTYHLNAGIVTIGRDAYNKIKIDDPAVARYHVLLRRFPSETSPYAYELIIGEEKVRLCHNGICLNQISRRNITLTTGDALQLGSTRISYLVASMSPEEYSRYFHAQSITNQRQQLAAEGDLVAA